MDLRTKEVVLAKKMSFFNFILQGRWLLSDLRCKSDAHLDEVYNKLLAANFLQGNYARSMLKGKEWKGQITKSANCFTPLNEALKFRFPILIQKKT